MARIERVYPSASGLTWPSSYFMRYSTGPWMLSIDEATTVSAYIVTLAKEFVEGCGGSTFVRALDDCGHDIRLGPDEVRNAVEYYEKLFR